MSKSAVPTMPDGIDNNHLNPRRSRSISWYRALIISALLAAALFGLLGGTPTPERRVATDIVDLRVHLPDPVRNGMFVEWRIDVKARRDVADLVVAIPANLWTDITINSLIPAASEERFQNGEYMFSFGAVEAGKQLVFKIDGQVNPPRITSERGIIRLLDGDRELAAVPVRMRVVP